MSALSSPAQERSRKALSTVLQALSPAGTQCNLARAMGVSEATISRTVSQKLEDSVALLYQLGFKVVHEDRICVDRDKFEAMATIARAALSCPDTSRKLIWDEE